MPPRKWTTSSSMPASTCPTRSRRLSCALTPKTPGKFLEKVLDSIATGVGMPQFVNADVMMNGPCTCGATPRRTATLPLSKARRTCVGACVGSYIPYETGHPVEGQPNLGKVLELTMHNGFDPRTKQQVGPEDGRSGELQGFRGILRGLRAAASVLRGCPAPGAWIANMLNADFLPCTWRSILTKGCIERGTETWKGGANYYTVAQISVGGVDAGNGLMAIKDLVYDKKKLSMAEAEGGPGWPTSRVRRTRRSGRCATRRRPNTATNLEEPDAMVRRVNDSILAAFNNVDGGGTYIDKDMKVSLDQYTKSVHNLMGLVTGALPTGKKAGCRAHRRQPVGHAGYRHQRRRPRW